MGELKISLDAKVELIIKYNSIKKKSEILEEEKIAKEEKLNDIKKLNEINFLNLEKNKRFILIDYHHFIFKIYRQEKIWLSNFDIIKKFEKEINLNDAKIKSSKYFEAVLEILKENENNM